MTTQTQQQQEQPVKPAIKESQAPPVQLVTERGKPAPARLAQCALLLLSEAA